MPNSNLKQALEEYAMRDMPVKSDLWPHIRRQLKVSSKNRLHLPYTRLGWATLSVVLALTIGTVAYATGTFILNINKPSQMDPTFQPLDGAKVLMLKQTVNGQTVTFQQAYADTKRIQIYYLLNSSQGVLPAVADTSLIDEQGHSFKLQLGSTSPNVQGGTAYAMEFSLNGLSTLPSELKLHLSFNLINTMPEGTPIPMIPGSKPAQNVLAGPFNFDFTVPLTITK